MPNSMVTTIPPGSFPGIKSFAMAPVIKPMMSITIIDMVAPRFLSALELVASYRDDSETMAYVKSLGVRIY